MSLENQLGSIAARVRQLQSTLQAIEDDLAVEKTKLQQVLDDLKSLNDQLRPKL